MSLNIAFIGLGNMGQPMVANLAKAGFDLKLHDLDQAHTQALAKQHGARACADWASLAQGTDVVITMLPTGAIVRDVLLDRDGGLAAHLQPGTLVVDMSSSEPLATQELAGALAERGLALVDAPVSGGVPGAVAGTLSIMAGCDAAENLQRLAPVFAAMGKRVFHTGNCGSGHAMKALNNFVAASAYVATAEALAIGTRFGLEAAQIVDIINVSTGRSFNSEVVFSNHVVPGTFNTGFALGLLAKDVGIATGLGQALEIDAPLSLTVHQRWKQAREDLGEQVDQSLALTAWSR